MRCGPHWPVPEHRQTAQELWASPPRRPTELHWTDQAGADRQQVVPTATPLRGQVDRACAVPGLGGGRRLQAGLGGTAPLVRCDCWVGLGLASGLWLPDPGAGRKKGRLVRTKRPAPTPSTGPNLLYLLGDQGYFQSCWFERGQDLLADEGASRYGPGMAQAHAGSEDYRRRSAVACIRR